MNAQPASVTAGVQAGDNPPTASVTAGVQADAVLQGAAFFAGLQAQQKQWKAALARHNGLSEFPRYFGDARNGGVCGHCGKRFEKGEPIVIRTLGIQVMTQSRPFPQRYTVCVSCAGGIPDNAPRYHCTICGREVIGRESFGRKARKLSAFSRWVLHPCCSLTCYWTVAKRRQRSISQETRPISTCWECGGAIPNNRRGDSRYCSPACRQKAYRQRLQGAVR